jgi:ABC-type polysaccharide/polyol phosphate export permease
MKRGFGRSETARAPVFESVSGGRENAAALSDIAGGLARFRLVLTMIGAEFSNRYKGSLLGVFWLTATALMTVLGLGIVYSQVLGTAFELYLPYVAIGMTVWGLISAILSESVSVFSNAHGVYSQMRVPKSLFVYNLVGRNIYAFFFRSLVVIPLLYVRDETISPLAMGESLAGLALLFWIGFWVTFPLGLLGARYRDTSQVIVAFVTFAFFLTPVFWQGDRLGEYSFIVDFNPLHHFINVVRGPLLNEPGVLTSFMVTGAFAVILPVLAVKSFARNLRRMAYW